MIISNSYAGCQLDFKSAIERPAWTSEDWEAYNHKHSLGKIKLNYYVKTKRRQNARTK